MFIEFMEAVQKFNKGDRGDLIAILKEDAKKMKNLVMTKFFLTKCSCS